ncbi:MAG: hypothetical protein LDLANPLL_02108 [Turneriella sp.]|nr:hypothetical protein [Turneriella sp.]
MDEFANWYGFLFERKSEFAETIYRRFLDRLEAYTDGHLPDAIKREHALRYLLPSIHLLKSPFVFPDMARAVMLLRESAAKRIVIYGDRDADGVTSAALLTLFLREQLKVTPANLVTLVPQEEDKYGVTGDVVRRVVDTKPDLLITLDCGSSNRAELLEICEATGCRTIIIDHHFIPPLEEDFPKVDAFINPKRLPEYDFARDYCTAAIVLRFIQAVLFSYTRDFNEEISITTDTETIFLKNGVLLENPEASAVTRHYTLRKALPLGMGEAHDLEKIFEHIARENFEVRKIFNFYQKAPSAFSALEVFNAVQSASFRKVQAILAPYIPLAAIGLVADLMPIYADNRILVRSGLEIITRQLDALPMGLLALLKKLNLANTVAEQDLSFTLCPVINAAGRMGSANIALDALLQKDPLEAAKAAHTLVKLNDERKESSKRALELLDEALDIRSYEAPIAVAIHAKFHRGLSGLIASKISEKLAKPSVVLVPDGTSYRGSIRAYTNENVYHILESLSMHLLQFGGHKQAAGFSIAEENLPQFIDALFAFANTLFQKGSKESEEINLDPFRNFNPPLEIEVARMRTPLWDELLIHAPYGVINPHPIVKILNSGKVELSPLGKTGAHAKLRFSQPADTNIEGVWFFHGGKAESVIHREAISISGEPQVGKFMGRLQYRLKITQVTVRE